MSAGARGSRSRHGAGLHEAPPATSHEAREPLAPRGAGEPPPYRVVNAGGSAPYLLICDHASRYIPPAFGHLGLEAPALEQHIAWDIGTAEVVPRLARRLDAPAVLAGYSRLLIDPNRFPGDPTSIPPISDGVVVPGNRDVTPEEAERRARLFFRPYHEAVTAELERLRARHGVPALISVHSFTPEFQGFARPWHVGILSDHDRRVADPLLERLQAEAGLHVGDNQPYSARNPPGYSVAVHAERPGYPHALIEIRQDLIETPGGAERWAERLARALGDVLADSALFRVHRRSA